MGTTDAQAALAAAALIVSSQYGNARSPLSAELITTAMADAFLGWLKRQEGTTVERNADERLVPNEDFRSPGQARTERIDPGAVLAAAGQATAQLDLPWRTPEGAYTGPHVRGGPACTTPSGAYACLCGEKWPCSRSEPYRRRVGLPI